MVRIAREVTRFSSKKSIDDLFKRSRRVVKHSGIHILTAPTDNPFGRVLVIAPRRVGNAVQRNLIRRRIRSIFYQNALFKWGYDCIALIKPGGADLSFTELSKLFLRAYKRS